MIVSFSKKNEVILFALFLCELRRQGMRFSVRADDIAWEVRFLD
jgi:hypothetical protein